MSITRSFLILVAALQMCSTSVLAATPVGGVAAPTPEVKMLESVLALQGMALPPNQLRARFSDVVNGYLASAPREGQQERFEQALVDLKMYNANEAASLMADSENASLSADEISRIAANYPMGAQFSSCVAETAGGILAAFGGVGFVVSLLAPHYPDNEANSITYCGGGGPLDTTPCSQADYWRSNTDREHELIITGIMTAVGVILLHVSQGSC